MKKIELTENQIAIIRKGIANGISPKKVYESYDFDGIELRTFYRRYKSEAFSMGKKRRTCHWTERQEALLKTIENSPYEDIRNSEEDLGHNIAQIRDKARKSGLSLERKNPLWTDEEDEKLLSLSHTKSVKDIYESGVFVGRSTAALYGRLRLLKSQASFLKKRWDKDELDKLKNMLDNGADFSTIKEAFPNRSESSIRTKISYARKG